MMPPKSMYLAYICSKSILPLEAIVADAIVAKALVGMTITPDLLRSRILDS